MKTPPAHTRFNQLPFRWPDPPFHIVLVNPEIPPNTGNIARLCAATGSILHLIEPLGFKITDSELKRAGLDYWKSVDIRVHTDFDAYLAEERPARLFLFSTAGGRSFHDARFRPGDALVFGCETRGLPEHLLARYPGQVLGIPVRPEHVRSLNLSTAAGIALYEALRQAQPEWITTKDTKNAKGK
ncbi:MAG TPA: tRNA (cytidine(34)-2'-O)-methyltransferase [Kiritimatiellia bacterium]|nr:tRNA (cytidine(34)-2'-O)-methyltransferase [Kiritimatiellia bacterium]HRZ10998.1 tRNA (cytidine(34)-2'-O)-methyltransferase [Kiritimatiellia bacterium]HSA18571.1 tRNA (cytidine(34)-2'-O)-methyltransferase [Kiritimatiellia bacterium]